MTNSPAVFLFKKWRKSLTTEDVEHIRKMKREFVSVGRGDFAVLRDGSVHQVGVMPGNSGKHRFVMMSNSGLFCCHLTPELLEEVDDHFFWSAIEFIHRSDLRRWSEVSQNFYGTFLHSRPEKL
ncbi:MAG: hypothetical protein WCW90_02465 [Candidatus Paceibacterota bacterium]|jgi:hypothetical protein